MQATQVHRLRAAHHLPVHPDVPVRRWLLSWLLPSEVYFADQIGDVASPTQTVHTTWQGADEDLAGRSGRVRVLRLVVD